MGVPVCYQWLLFCWTVGALSTFSTVASVVVGRVVFASFLRCLGCPLQVGFESFGGWVVDRSDSNRVALVLELLLPVRPDLSLWFIFNNRFCAAYLVSIK